MPRRKYGLAVEHGEARRRDPAGNFSCRNACAACLRRSKPPVRRETGLGDQSRQPAIAIRTSTTALPLPAGQDASAVPDFRPLDASRTRQVILAGAALPAFDLGHDAHRFALDVGHGLHIGHARQPREDQFHRVVNPGYVLELLASAPSGFPRGSTLRSAPTRISNSFGRPGAERNLPRSNSTGVKQGRWSPTSLPFRKTRVPYIALWIFSRTDSAAGPSSTKLRRYQNACRCSPLLARAHLDKRRPGQIDQSGHRNLMGEFVRHPVHEPWAICQFPSSEIVRRAEGIFAPAPATKAGERPITDMALERIRIVCHRWEKREQVKNNLCDRLLWCRRPACIFRGRRNACIFLWQAGRLHHKNVAKLFSYKPLPG